MTSIPELLNLLQIILQMLRRLIKQERERIFKLIEVPDDDPWLARLRNKTRELFVKNPGHRDTLQMACLARCCDQVLLFIAGHDEWEKKCLKAGELLSWE